MGPYILLALLMGVVIVLVSGVVLMGVGGKTNLKYGNRLMRARIILQGAAVLVLLLLFAMSGK